MMCPKCGAIVNENDKICTSCGTLLNQIKQPEASIENTNTVLNDNLNVNEIPTIVENVNSQMPDNPIVEEPNTNTVEELQNISGEEPAVNLQSNFMGQPPVNDVPTEQIANTVNEQPVNNIPESTVNSQPNFMGQPPVNNVPIQEVTPNITKSSSNGFKNKGLLIGIIVIVILAIAGLFLFFTSKSSPKTVFKSAINKFYSSVDKQLQTDVKTISGSVSLSTDFSGMKGSSKEMTDLISDISISGNYGIDYGNKTLKLDLKSNYKDKELLNGLMYFSSNKGYVFLEDIFDKYLSTDIEKEEYDNIFSKTEITDDHIYVFKSMKDALISSLKDNYFVKESATIKVDGKDVKVTKNALKIDEKDAKEIVTSILNKLNDKKFIDSYCVISGQESADVKEIIEDAIEQYKPSSSDGTEEIEISIYTKGLTNSFVKFEIAANTTTIELTEDSENKYSFKMVSDAEEMVSGTVEISKKDKETVYKVSIKNDEFGTIGFTFGYYLEYNKKIEETDVSNSIAIDKLTEEDTQSIMSKLEEKESLQSIISLIQGMTSTSVGYSDYDMDYDYSDTNNYLDNYDYSDDNDYFNDTDYLFEQ